MSIVGGGNDILRNHTDVDVLAEHLEGAVAAIRATGADVLMATPVDPKGAPIIRRTRSRVAAYTADIWGIANRHRCHVIDQWSLRSLRDWRMWAEDRIHLSSEGHRRVALAALDALGHPTDASEWRAPLDPLPPAAPLPPARGRRPMGGDPPGAVGRPADARALRRCAVPGQARRAHHVSLACGACPLTACCRPTTPAS